MPLIRMDIVRKNLKKINLNEFASLILLFGLVIVCTMISPVFLRSQNIINILRQISIVTILAFGQTFLIICGQLDLSMGNVAGMCGVFAVILYISIGSLILAILFGIVLGLIMGAINGFIVTAFDAPPFIVTLAMQSVAIGIIYTYTNGQNIYSIGDFRILGQGMVGFIPLPIIIMLLIFIGASIMLRKMKFGRYLYAIGGNEEAAKASGLKVKTIKFKAYVITGGLAGLGGVILMSRLNAGLPSEGFGYETDAIMACIIGGTSFTGGVGTAFGTLIGSLIIGILNNILTLTGVQSYVQMILKGSLIIIAVVVDLQTKKNRKKVKILSEE